MRATEQACRARRNKHRLGGGRALGETLPSCRYALATRAARVPRYLHAHKHTYTMMTIPDETRDESARHIKGRGKTCRSQRAGRRASIEAGGFGPRKAAQNVKLADVCFADCICELRGIVGTLQRCQRVSPLQVCVRAREWRRPGCRRQLTAARGGGMVVVPQGRKQQSVRRSGRATHRRTDRHAHALAHNKQHASSEPPGRPV
jgi:hypothetical protein